MGSHQEQQDILYSSGVWSNQNWVNSKADRDSFEGTTSGEFRVTESVEDNSRWDSVGVGTTQQIQASVDQGRMVQAGSGVDTLYHYCIVRRDLPIGVIAAQLVHAAGESAQLIEVPPHTHAVVLSVPDEEHLLHYEKKLIRAGVQFSAIREPDAPWNGQLMTIGIRPQPRKKIKKLLANLPLYK